MSDTIAAIGGAQFLPPNSPHFKSIRDSYKCPNPAYEQAHALRNKGKWVNIPDQFIYASQTIPLWHKWGGGLMVPRGIRLSERWGDLDFVDAKTFPPLREGDERLSFMDGIELRPYQNKAVWELVKHNEGLVIAPCGAGKTMVGLGALINYDTRVVILVHTHDLAKQWHDRIVQQLQTETGKIPNVTIWGGGKKKDSGQIVIAMMQSLARERWDELHEWGKQFGVCIVDECHHVPASTFSQVMMAMPAEVRLGLTATPERADGLTDILYWHFGKELARTTTQELIDEGRVMAPTVRFTATKWTPSKKMDWPKLVSTMCADVERNAQILDMVEEFIRDGRQILVLSDRVQHCIDMADMTAGRGFDAAALVGKLTKKQRAEILRAADARELKAIFATTVADEGLDLPGLDTMILTTPTKAMGKIQQRIGRIMRTAVDKRNPVVIDLVDNSKPLFYLHRKRSKFYTELGCTVESLW